MNLWELGLESVRNGSALWWVNCGWNSEHVAPEMNAKPFWKPSLSYSTRPPRTDPFKAFKFALWPSKNPGSYPHFSGGKFPPHRPGIPLGGGAATSSGRTRRGRPCGWQVAGVTWTVHLWCKKPFGVWVFFLNKYVPVRFKYGVFCSHTRLDPLQNKTITCYQHGVSAEKTLKPPSPTKHRFAQEYI